MMVAASVEALAGGPAAMLFLGVTNELERETSRRHILMRE
jgi:hypothetical protein